MSVLYQNGFLLLWSATLVISQYVGANIVLFQDNPPHAWKSSNKDNQIICIQVSLESGIIKQPKRCIIYACTHWRSCISVASMGIALKFSRSYVLIEYI